MEPMLDLNTGFASQSKRDHREPRTQKSRGKVLGSIRAEKDLKERATGAILSLALEESDSLESYVIFKKENEIGEVGHYDIITWVIKTSRMGNGGKCWKAVHKERSPS